GLHRSIYLWFRRLRFSGCSHFWFSATSGDGCCGFAVTRNPTAEWLARQITEAFPWDGAPKYLIRDNDKVFGPVFKTLLRAMGIRDRPTSFRSPWQNGYVERLIGSIRRECTDHLLVFNAEHLRRILAKYATYYNEVRKPGGSTSSTRCGKSRSFMWPVISPLRRLMRAARSCYAFVSSLSRTTRSCSSFALLMRYSNSRPL